MKRIAVIPARAGSKRLPAKNKLLFRGRPLVEHTLIAAREAGVFDRVIVSSDDEEILKLGKKYGFQSERRPAALAADQATVSDVCVDLLSRHTGFELMCCLYATAPLRSAADVRESLALIEKTGAAAVLCATRYLHPAHQALMPASGDGWKPAFPEWANKQSQSVSTLRVDNGSCYWVRVPEFLAKKSFYLDPLQIHEMPLELSLDLDTPDDWNLFTRLWPE
jgi:CMP-N-acetylneuraminic acid synthetase